MNKKLLVTLLASTSLVLSCGTFLVVKGIKDNKIKVKALSTTAVWYGMTYKEDKELLVSAINEMVKQGLYPDNLWN